MAERELLVRIVGDDRDLQRALGSTDRRLEQMDGRMQKFGTNIARTFRGAGIALGATAITAFTARAIKGASDLNEEISKSRQVFGDSSRSIEDWADTTAESIGVTNTAALQATGTFGNLFVTLGTGQDEAAKMSTTLVQLAADLGSFNNADPSDVLQAIRSGLIGEAEPLRRYGILLSEARVQQVALATSGKQNVRELTNQEKALARFQIIMEDSASAQGDFARTSDSLANQSKILKAQLEQVTTELGQNLLPAMVKVVGVANSLVSAFNALGDSVSEPIKIDVDETSLNDLLLVRDRIAEIRGETDFLVIALDRAIERLRAIQPLSPNDQGGLQGPGAVTASNLEVDQRNAENAAKEAQKNLEIARKRFEEFIKGMGLKLDRAGLTQTLNDDIAVLREIERAIKRRIRAEGKTFELVSQLTQVQLQIASTVAQQQADAEAARNEAVMDAAEAQAKRDEKRLQEIQRKNEQRQQNQFRQLGLTGTGDQRVPGVGALRRRLANIRNAVEGTVLDTPKTEAQLDNIAKVLSGKFGKVGREVRQAILQMFNAIAGALDEGGKKTKGPLTKTSGLNTSKLLAGLGLTEEQIRELRRRHAGFNTAGRALAGGINVPSGGFQGRPGMGGNNFVIHNHVTVEVDGKKLTGVVTKKQQQAKKRNPSQKRGPNSGNRAQ